MVNSLVLATNTVCLNNAQVALSILGTQDISAQTGHLNLPFLD